MKRLQLFLVLALTGFSLAAMDQKPRVMDVEIGTVKQCSRCGDFKVSIGGVDAFGSDLLTTVVAASHGLELKRAAQALTAVQRFENDVRRMRADVVAQPLGDDWNAIKKGYARGFLNRQD